MTIKSNISVRSGLLATLVLMIAGCQLGSPDPSRAEANQLDRSVGDIATLEFDAAWTETVKGTVRRGAPLRIRYAPSRLPACRAADRDGWRIRVGLYFGAGESVGLDLVPGADGLLEATTSVPPSAERVEVWFVNRDSTGCVEYDSNFGHNYAYSVAAPLPDELGAQVQVFFSPFQDVESEVLAVLDEAREEVLIAHYNIRRQPVLDKLVALAQAGVTVRVVVDEKNAGNDWNTGDDFLEANGVELLRTKPASSYALMHLKVAVIDRETVLTGSFNWNTTAALANDENMLVIRNPALARIYAQEVLEWLGDHPREIQGGNLTDEVAVHFAPEEALDGIIGREIDGARTSVSVSMFVLTKRSVGQALLRAVDRGVEVTLITEEKMHRYSSVDEQLEAAGALVIRGANTLTEHSAMHHKYGVIDGRVVITGAANWTHNGTTNSAEDILILRHPGIAAAFQANFDDLLYVYGELDQGRTRDSAPTLFRLVNDDTAPGDRLVVVGNVPQLGAWNLQAGLEVTTTDGFYPNWTARGTLPAGAHVEYKFVLLRADGGVEWEPGENRILDVPASGRAVVVSGLFGDTARSWTPADGAGEGE